MGHLTADCDDVIIITVNHSSFLVDISDLSGTGRFKVGSGHSLDLYSLDGRAQEITLPIFKQNGFSFLISFLSYCCFRVMQFAYWCCLTGNIPTGYVRRDRRLNHKYLRLLIFCQIYEIIIQHTYLDHVYSCSV